MARDCAGRVAEHLRAVLQLCRCWPPAAPQPVLEQLGGVGPMIPHGDRRDRPESSGIEDQEVAAVQLEHDIMSVLVLSDDLRHLPRRRGTAGPGKDVGQSVKMGELGCQSADVLRRDIAGRRERNLSHVEIYTMPNA